MTDIILLTRLFLLKNCLINNQRAEKKVVENVLIGYVKSDADFETINIQMIYYIRGGNRPGAMQFGQVSKPIKWLLLHRQNRQELYRLQTGIAEKCNRDKLKQYGFYPRGDEYWMYKIKEHITDPILLQTLLKAHNQFTIYPQIICVTL